MSKFDATNSGKSHLGLDVLWGITLGSIVGLFAVIFWFEMGISLLFSTAIGLIIGTAIGSIVENKSKLRNSSQNTESN